MVVVVRARAAELERLSRSLRKHRYVQEMVRLYNRANLCEKCSLTVSVSLCNLALFESNLI